MDSHLAKLLRRSRPHHRAVANANANMNGTLEKKGAVKDVLNKRLTPEQLSAIQASNSLQSARAAGQTPATTAAGGGRNPATPVTAGATEAVGGAASRVQTQSAAPATPARSSSSSSSAARSSAAPSSSSVRPSSSSTSARPSSSSTSVRPSTSSTRTTTSTSSSTRPSVLTVTSSRASSTSSSAASSASAAAASQSSSSSSLSTGAIAGIALATLVGLVMLGSIVGWLYRKHAQRKYTTKAAPWSKLDDDITPYPHGGSEKQPYLTPDEDIYGQSAAPVIGSRRALALARDNAFRPDGSMRPDSDYMIPRESNRAGYGAGNGLGAQYGAYPAMHPPGGYDYGQPTHGYGQDASPVTQDYDYNQPGMAVSAPGNTRQLVGPSGQPQSHSMPMPAPVPLGPVAMGRPAPPQSAAEFADREEFMDLPRPTPAATSSSNSGAHLSQYSTYGLAYADSEPDYLPHTATTTGWAGDAKMPPQSAAAGHTPLPHIEPASPLMSGFDFQKRQSQPLGPIAANFASKYGPSNSTLPMYEDEDEGSRQKRMYGEVAHAAGVQEPVTPHTADLSHSTNSHESASSFSAHEPSDRSASGPTTQRLPRAPLPNLPIVNLTPPQPYQHGQPLSPLPEVATPASTVVGGMGAPLSSSSLMHGQEVNPFETVSPDQNLLSTPRAPAFRPPHSATSTTGATSFPSPNYPPPSPGGMSVPGSVSDSPRNKRESMFESDDAYGGI